MVASKHEENRLADEISRVALAMERQNSLRRKFAMGVLFGVGTALGASVIASILVLIFSSFLRSVGLNPDVLSEDATRTMETQIRLQTPQD